MNCRLRLRFNPVKSCGHGGRAEGPKENGPRQANQVQGFNARNLPWENSRPSSRSRRFFETKAAIFHLASVAFESDGTVGGKLHRGFQHFPVAKTVGHTVF